MKIKVDYTPSYIKKTLNPGIYEMADGTKRYYYQIGKGELNDEDDKYWHERNNNIKKGVKWD